MHHTPLWHATHNAHMTSKTLYGRVRLLLVKFLEVSPDGARLPSWTTSTCLPMRQHSLLVGRCLVENCNPERCCRESCLEYLPGRVLELLVPILDSPTLDGVCESAVDTECIAVAAIDQSESGILALIDVVHN